MLFRSSGVVDVQLSVARPPGCGDFTHVRAIARSLNIATRAAAGPVNAPVPVVLVVAVVLDAVDAVDAVAAVVEVTAVVAVADVVAGAGEAPELRVARYVAKPLARAATTAMPTISGSDTPPRRPPRSGGSAGGGGATGGGGAAGGTAASGGPPPSLAAGAGSLASPVDSEPGTATAGASATAGALAAMAGTGVDLRARAAWRAAAISSPQVG